MKTLTKLLAVAGLMALVTSGEAHAQDRRVIQNRLMGLNHEFTLELGLLPLDVLYKAPTLTGRYTWHINDFVAWEVLSLSYAPTTDLGWLSGVALEQLNVGGLFAALPFTPSFNHLTSQGNDLVELHGKNIFDIDQMRMFAESNLIIKPLYGKFSLFNRRNARVELFAVGGLALANFIAFNPYPFDPLAAAVQARNPTAAIPAIPSTPQGFLPQPNQTFVLRPGADIGGGLRWFVGKTFSLRLDARAYGFLEGYNGLPNFAAGLPTLAPGELPTLPIGFTQVLYIGVGTSFSFGGAS